MVRMLLRCGANPHLHGFAALKAVMEDGADALARAAKQGRHSQGQGQGQEQRQGQRQEQEESQGQEQGQGQGQNASGGMHTAGGMGSWNSETTGVSSVDHAMGSGETAAAAVRVQEPEVTQTSDMCRRHADDGVLRYWRAGFEVMASDLRAWFDRHPDPGQASHRAKPHPRKMRR